MRNLTASVDFVRQIGSAEDEWTQSETDPTTTATKRFTAEGFTPCRVGEGAPNGRSLLHVCQYTNRHELLHRVY